MIATFVVILYSLVFTLGCVLLIYVSQRSRRLYIWVLVHYVPKTLSLFRRLGLLPLNLISSFLVHCNLLLNFIIKVISEFVFEP